MVRKLSRSLGHPKRKVDYCTYSLRPKLGSSFSYTCDASHKAIGASLGHIDDKLPYSIYFINKNLLKAKLNYTVMEKELLDVVHSLNNFRHYIIGYQTFVDIDHVVMKYLMNKPNVNAWIIR